MVCKMLLKYVKDEGEDIRPGCTGVKIKMEKESGRLTLLRWCRIYATHPAPPHQTEYD